MTIHNIMEERIAERVNILYDEIKKEHPEFLTCDCKSCRSDTLCYVLNRIPPRYIVSGRGITHSSLSENTQLKADMDAFIIEGMRIVSTAKRPYHNTTTQDQNIKNAPAFVFPAFIGTVYDGNTFEPISNAQIELLCNGNPVSMEDITWSNPCYTYQSTQGTYSFKPASISAEELDSNKEFSFTLKITAKDYEPLVYSFIIPVKSGMENNKCFSIKLQDSYLFAHSDENEKKI